jgi:3-oxoadipate enol-lactonase
MRLVRDTHVIHYDLLGDGENGTVCFAHALAADSGMWAEQVPAVLGAGYRVLRIDMRGHGGSAGVSGDYTLAMLAGDISAVIAARGLPPVHYVGLSIGGMIGQALALHHPAQVASLTLCEAPPAALKNAHAIWQPRIDAVCAANSVAPVADDTMARWLTPQFAARYPDRFAQIRDTIAATTPEGYCGCVAALSHFDFTAQLPSLRVPALVICGEDDPATSIAENERLAALIPGGRFHRFAKARHLPNVEDPARFNAILTDWLAAQR